MIHFSKLPRPAPVGKEVANRHPKWSDVHCYVPGSGLAEAVELAIALQMPLLITGDPGSGKTVAAYWAAWMLSVKPDNLFHVHVRSDSTAQTLTYEFDAVSYFREAQLASVLTQRLPPEAPIDRLDRSKFIQKGQMWDAFVASNKGRVVLLIDEIDKAPRDFPNDLLHEFDAKTISTQGILDSEGKQQWVKAKMGEDGLGLIVLTSNREHELPEAFLRRCLYYHVQLDKKTLHDALGRHVEHRKITVTPGEIDRALDRYLELRDVPGLRHKPGFGELIVWLEALTLVEGGLKALTEAKELGDLLCLGALLKYQEDIRAVAPER